MMLSSIYGTYQRRRTLQTSRISSLPILILMPHSACNCRCVMCDIWKGNQNLKQLTQKDIEGLSQALKKYNTRQVLMSGGEALLNPGFFTFCSILKKEKIKISLLSTGLTLKKNAAALVAGVDDIIVSLDGDEGLHDAIRNIPGAFNKLREGIQSIRDIDARFPVSGRCVIHRLNFRQWPDIINAAKQIGLDKISFLPADLSSNAFNRETAWDEPRQHEIVLSKNDLPELQQIIDMISADKEHDIRNGFIAESAEKLQMIHDHYAAFYGIRKYPEKKCNATYVSAVIEPDGNVRPCFFHKPYGNIKNNTLEEIINSPAAIAFRKNLDISKNETCIKCVCYLNLPAGKKIA